MILSAKGEGDEVWDALKAGAMRHGGTIMEERLSTTFTLQIAVRVRYTNGHSPQVEAAITWTKTTFARSPLF